MGIIERIKRFQRERDKKKEQEWLQESFQIAERGGEIWLTFDGVYILPCSMLNQEPVKALETIRKMHLSF